MGVLVWQEAMFACALYPYHDEFLTSVRREIAEQVWRLGSHPSVAMWCGNNEIEANNVKPADRATYSLLNYDTVMATFLAADTTRPLWPSSPSNGFKTLHPPTAAWGNAQAWDQGDVHHYIYTGDCTDPAQFPNARFVSEYGWFVCFGLVWLGWFFCFSRIIM